MIIYVVSEHWYEDRENHGVKVIGAFTSLENAEAMKDEDPHDRYIEQIELTE